MEPLGYLFIRDSSGDVCACPDDYFTEFGVSVFDWVQGNDINNGQKENSISFLNICSERMKVFQTAKNMAGDYIDMNDLRHAPRVIENYTPMAGFGRAETYIFFKQENNGTTVKIKVPNVDK